VTILIIGYYGFANAGDESILASILAEFRARRPHPRLPDLRLIVSSGDPAGTAADHGVSAVAWNDIAALSRAIEIADLVIVGGGGLFHDYWGADPDTLLSGAHWGGSYYAGCAFLATLFRKPLMLYGVGVGPLHSDYGIRLTRAVCDAASLITVRDSASLALLEKTGVPGAKIRVTADPAFAFVPRERAPLEDLIPPEFTPRRPLLGVAARKWDVGVHPDFIERELAAAIDLFTDETGGSALLVPFQDLRGEQEDDRATAARIVSRLRFPARAAIAPAPLSADRVYSALASCDVALAMRLHALIFAATARIPSVALSYDPKVAAAAGSLGGSEAPIDVKNIDAHVLARRLVWAWRSGQTPSVERLRDLSGENCSLALDLLDLPIPEAHLSADALDLLRRAIQSQIAREQLLKASVADLEERIQKFDVENATLRTSVLDLQQSVQAFDAENSVLRNSVADLAALRVSLYQADESRAAVVAGIDHFQSVLDRNLADYRAQRAWTIMLVFRKAYTLLTRGSKLSFLKWALGVPFGKVGSLEAYQLPFPDLSNYVPQTFRRSILAPAVPEDVAAPEADPLPPVQGNLYDAVVLAIVDFDFRFQRPQQIASELARRGHRVFWISPSRFLPPSSDKPYDVAALRSNVWEIRLRCPAPDIYMGELNQRHLDAMASSLTALYTDWGIAESVVLAQLPFWRRLALDLRAKHGSKVLYDCMDDWETFQNMGAFNVSEEKTFVVECDVLVVTGAELQLKYEAQGLHPVLVRNGADYAFFSTAGPNHLLDGMIEPGASDPVVGYFGAIADWIDLDLVHEVARLRPQYRFVLIGQVFGRDVSALEALPNVSLLGNKRYEDIPSYLYRFDACLIPFLLNQVTKATDPVKLYEYFCLGKPVIATDMAELAQCGDLLYIGRGAEDFAFKIDTALAEPDDRLHRRRIAFARTHTWGARVDRMNQAVQSVFPRVSILIVTYNSEGYVKPCLDSIFRNTAYPSYEVIVVDNASSDKTVALLEEYADGGRIHLITLAENLGFAGGNNRAAQEARGEYLILLNVDTMVTPGWVHLLLEHIRRDPAIGEVCPVTNFAGNAAKINIDYRDASGMESFARRVAIQNRGKAIDIDVAALYCALLPRSLWDRAGGLDTTFGIGMFEDDDLSFAVREAGFRVVAAEDCFVHHFGQGSFSKLPGETYNRVFEANRRRFEEKRGVPWQPHHTRPGVRPAFEEERFDPATFVTEPRT
jgi:polysaccharide pyruvyl transferase CsaB